MEATKTKLKGSGGAGRGQGRKKGSKLPKTLEKLKQLEALKQRVFAMTNKLVNAQAMIALGTHKMICVHKTAEGMKAETVRDEDRMQSFLDTGVYGKDYLIVVGKEPDFRAGDALLNRAYGKPTESVEHSGRDGKPLIIKLDS